MRELVLAVVLLSAGLAGCIGSEEASPASSPNAAESNTTTMDARSAGPDTVIAFIDRGINPYHEAFRTDGPRAQHHPSTYLPDYPADARALNLTFDHDSLEEAIAADCEAWEDIDPGQLYWVPGTRVIGMTVPNVEERESVPGAEFSCADGDAGDDDGTLPIFLSEAEHGTMVASRGAGGEHGACEDCLIVSAQRVGSFRAQVQPVEWAANQSWIDVQSNSWRPGPPVGCPDNDLGCPGPMGSTLAAIEDAASRQPVFWASGNGYLGAMGSIAGLSSPADVGEPAPADPKNTPSVIRVGGHDNGHIILWPGSGPNIVSDACSSWAAEHESLNETTPRTGGGTSAAAPYAAGIAAQIIQDARGILDDDRTGIREGVLAEGNASSIDGGPLADGEFTKAELERVLYTTANPRPQETGDDGEFGCEFGGDAPPGIWAVPAVAWSDVPEGPAGIPLVGYGAVTQTTAEHARKVLSGEEQMPERAAEDAYFGVDRTQRETAYEAYTASGDETLAAGR